MWKSQIRLLEQIYAKNRYGTFFLVHPVDFTKFFCILRHHRNSELRLRIAISAAIYLDIQTQKHKHPLWVRISSVQKLGYIYLFSVPISTNMNCHNSFSMEQRRSFLRQIALETTQMSHPLADCPAMSFVFVCWQQIKIRNTNQLSWAIN